MAEVDLRTMAEVDLRTLAEVDGDKQRMGDRAYAFWKVGDRADDGHSDEHGRRGDWSTTIGFPFRLSVSRNYKITMLGNGEAAWAIDWWRNGVGPWLFGDAEMGLGAGIDAASPHIIGVTV
ncbi:unnamed protein product [Linum trigynum]|uniref:Uncharacterized protein n=1 Tax=Linum trigynum TaxID=586398 RepID=A0AAV2FTQ5_9ROSI